ncbi:alpha/beta hydrolase [Aeromicrobium sp.]|uniref:alpha/beta hydrolase n=1 Tax=Aeromicrobium sp. TaxID=1871063 RepID=UPI0028A880A3|nr:alpha/beta hydrolase [Aeromicrobium sp.]
MSRSVLTQSGVGAGRYLDDDTSYEDFEASVHQLVTHDGARVGGVLRRPPGRTGTVVTIMHPREDSTHHPLVGPLLRAGFAVWTQGSRAVNNDLSLLHEQALLDVAAGHTFLRDRGFVNVVTLGHSGGGTLAAFYHEQSARTPSQRHESSPSGKPVPLPEALMPLADGAVFVAPHPGQGVLLARLIDPSVVDESDPLSVDATLNLYDPGNGFAEPPATSRYESDFVSEYRAAQMARIERIDARAQELLADAQRARRDFAATGASADRRRVIAPRIMTIHRTDADPRCVDLSLDRSERPYGSLFGNRPDLTNYGLIGFARITTPDAWMSTWSVTTSRANFLRNATSVVAPSLLVEFTGDQACFPSDARAMYDALSSQDKRHVKVAGRHFGQALREGARSGADLAGEQVIRWLNERFPAG